MPDQKTLQETFEYREGNLYWKIRPANNVQIGDKVGNSRSYSPTSLKGKKIYVHQIVFMIFHGYLPSTIDFKDGNPHNTRINNLREASRSKAIANSRKRSNNTSGYKGVSWNHRSEKWASYITKEKKTMHLGYFTDKEEAYRAYCNAAVKYHGEFANLG